MRHLRLALLGFLLLLPFGCGSKPEEAKTPEKTEQADAEAAKNKAAQNTSNTTPANNTTSNNTPSKLGAQGGGSTYALLPQGTTVLLSARPSSALESPFFKGLPNTDELDKEMEPMRKDLGFDLHGVKSITVALWPGDGHIIPQLPQMMGQVRGRPEKPEDFPNEEVREPLDKFKDCNAQPGDDVDPEEPGPGGPDGPGGFGGLGGPGGGGGGMLQQMIMGLLPKFDGALFLQFNQPVDLKKWQANMEPLQALQSEQFQGKSIWVHPALPLAGGVAVYQPDANSLVITFKEDLADIFQNKGPSPLVSQANAAGSNAELTLMLDFQPFQGALAMLGGMVAQQAPGADQIINQLKGTSLFVDMNTGVDVNATLEAKDEQTIATIKQAYDENAQASPEQIEAMLGNQGNLSEESQAEVKKLAESIQKSLKAEAKGKQFQISFRVPETAPAVVQKIAEEQRKAMAGINNLKQIGIAAHNYDLSYNKFPFPAGARDADNPEAGKLSWRVHLLPHLDESALYEQFKLDEPWDSEHNKKLLDKMPDVFKVSDQAKPGHTQIVAPAGKGYVIDGDRQVGIRDFTDGTSNSIMVLTVKPDKAEPWTKPGGFAIDPAKAAELLGGQGTDQFLGLFADASVHKLPVSIDAEDLKALLTIGGGEIFDRSILFGESDFGAAPDFGPEPESKEPEFKEPQFKDVPEKANPEPPATDN